MNTPKPYTDQTDSLEELLIQSRSMSYPQLQEDLKKKYEPVRNFQRARKGASLLDLIQMIASLVSKVMKKYQVTFNPDEGHNPNDTEKNLGHPCICYKLISRIPLSECKPRVIEEINDGDRRGISFMQRFTSIVQFNIYAGDYRTADTVMNVFEELMLRYTGFFKENGISEVLFQKQLTDDNLEKYRQSRSVRSLQYRVDTQTIYADFNSTFEEIDSVTSNV